MADVNKALAASREAIEQMIQRALECAPRSLAPYPSKTTCASWRSTPDTTASKMPDAVVGRHCRLMAYDEQLANRIRRAFGDDDVTERKTFGGLAFLSCGRMSCGIIGGGLMVRVPLDDFDARLRRPHVRPMDFTGRPLKGFVYVSPPGFRTATARGAWVSRGRQAAEAKKVAPNRTRNPRHVTDHSGRRAVSRDRRSS